MRQVYILLILLLLFFSAANKVFAKEASQVLIINQVRGKECCDKGNLDNLKLQINFLTKNNVPAVFVLRYDALNNLSYTNYIREEMSQFPDLINVGILLEITPDLARDSGVKYNTIQQDSLEAQNIYSIGYSDQDNIKIANTLFQKFYDDFGYYPKVTSSWMIKTNLLNYLNQTYGVNINQITREQFNVDGYTLYGGPPHYPYPASSNWAFIPDYTQSNPTLIVRQTLTDPLYNYGDNTGTFTSQPNDYLQNKDFNYFKQLLDQALLGQSQTGFALLGLENSMELKYQDEFIKQVNLLANYRNRKLIIFPSALDTYSFWKNQKINLYQGKDLVNKTNNQVFIISAPGYRIRLRRENEKVFIDDIRVYDSAFSEPYLNQPAKKKGYWIAPFLLQGFLENPKAEDFALLKPQPQAQDKFLSLVNDISSQTTRISLPDIGKGNVLVNQGGNSANVSYESRDGKKINLSFLTDSIKTSGINPENFSYQGEQTAYYPIKFSKTAEGFKLSWNIHEKTWLSLNTNCKSQNCSIKFQSNANLFQSALKNDYEYLLPEQIGHSLDSQKTVIYANNQYAIAGKNPVRMIIIPYDKYGLVTNLQKINIQISSPVSKNIIQDGQRYFVDLSSNSPTKAALTLNLGNGVTKNQTVYFAPNCKAQIKNCITHPKYFWWYTNAIIGNKTRQVLYGEKQ